MLENITVNDGFDRYKFDSLQSLLGDAFGVSDAQGNEVELTLVDVRKNALDGDRWDAMSILYKGDQKFRIPQGTYRFQHDRLGSVSLFVSPKSEVEYEVVITRKKPTEVS